MRAIERSIVIVLALGLAPGCLSHRREHERDLDLARERTGDAPWERAAPAMVISASRADDRLDADLKTGPSLALIREGVLRRNPNVHAALERWVTFLEKVPQRSVPAYPVFAFRYSSMFKMTEQGIVLGIPFPGKLVTETRAAIAEADAAREDFRALENTLRSQAIGAYAALYLARRQVEIVDENLALLTRFLESAQAKFKSGRATLSDVLRVETDRETLRAERSVLARSVEVATSGLNVLLDRHPEASIGPLVPPPEPAALPDPASFYARALASRPELLAARDRVNAADHMRDRAGQEWFPDVVVGTAYVRDLANENNFVDVTAGISLPPLLFPAITARVREAEAETRRSRDEARAVRNTVLDEVKSAHARTAAASERYFALEREVVPRVRRNIEASQSAYAAGQIDFLTLIDTQRTLLSALLEREASLTEHVTRQAELERAVGGSPTD